MKEYFEYRFDALDDDLDVLRKEFTIIKWGVGPKPNIEEVVKLIEAYRLYWNTNKSLTRICSEAGLGRNTICSFTRRTGLDLKMSEMDKLYFKAYGMSRNKYKYKWGGYSNDIERK